MSMTAEQFFQNFEKQMKEKYRPVFFKYFIVTFLVSLGIIGSFVWFLFRNVDAPKDNPNMFIHLSGVLVAVLIIISLIQASQSVRGSLMRNFKIDKEFEYMNLFEALTYFSKKDGENLSADEVNTMTEQQYEKYRLKEMEKLTSLTSNKTEQQASEEKKAKANELYISKSKTWKTRDFIYEYY